ncbi:MAG TPA: DUF4398 domain-containing protein, partial [Polyangiales bacterium]|nr:DUF4398 domain-containing protein [Polyangiales bacterium]
PAPTEQVASSLAAVRAAEEAGAKENPEAALHVKLAQEQLQQAHELMEHEHNAKAKDKAMRARNDAELALSLTHEQQANKKLESFRQAHQTAAQPAPQGDMQ